ncbi:MAG: hypothetical protein IJ507_04450 [Clostridia bacterium]|nr:hypothetical protein [Clostridia bacterium]
MRYVSTSPTASKAIGNVERELAARRKEAGYLGRLYRSGKLSPQELEKVRKRFTGIYRDILEEELQI